MKGRARASVIVASLAVCGAVACAGAAASTTVGAASVGRCHTSQLRLSIGPVQGAAGSRFYPIVLRNESGRTCTLRGFPGVSLLDADRHQIGPAATRNHSRPVRTIRLRPHHAASADFAVNTLACGAHPRKSRFVRVFPPNAFRSRTARLRAVACHPSVAPMVRGTTGD